MRACQCCCLSSSLVCGTVAKDVNILLSVSSSHMYYVAASDVSIGCLCQLLQCVLLLLMIFHPSPLASCIMIPRHFLVQGVKHVGK